MALESALRGKAWQSVSWLVLGEAAKEAAAAGDFVAAPNRMQRGRSAATYSPLPSYVQEHSVVEALQLQRPGIES